MNYQLQFLRTDTQSPGASSGLIVCRFLPDLPKFGEPLHNVTVSQGREAVFSCTVDNLQTYKVSEHPTSSCPSGGQGQWK